MTRHWQDIRRSPLTRLLIVAGLLVILSWAVLSSIQIGAVEVDPDTTYHAIADKISDQLGLGYTSDLDYNDRFVQRDSALILNIRLPRVVMAVLIGVGLGLSGSSLQGVLRNPLAEPSLIGVSSGAAVGAVLAIAYDLEWAVGGVELGITALAFMGGILSTLLVYRLATYQRRTHATNMLLIGVAVSAISTAFVGLMTFRAGQEKVGDILFWTLGSLGTIGWDEVEITLPFIVIAALISLFMARSLNVMALGEAEAGYLGIDVQRLRLIIIVLSAVMTGIGVAYAGIIGFVGLVVPHVIRLLFGPDYRLLLPASMIGGALFVVEADILARTVVGTSEIPLGVVTTLIGGPFFLFLIILYQRRGTSF